MACAVSDQMTLTASNRPQRFCALSYVADKPNALIAQSRPVHVLVLLSNDAKLEVYIAPGLRSLVKPEDWTYINALLNDLKERARVEPEQLFRQLSSLNVGPLICEMAGARIEDNVALSDTIVGFNRLD